MRRTRGEIGLLFREAVRVVVEVWDEP